MPLVSSHMQIGLRVDKIFKISRLSKSDLVCSNGSFSSIYFANFIRNRACEQLDESNHLQSL